MDVDLQTFRRQTLHIWLNVISNLNEDKLATFQSFEGINTGCHYQLIVITNFNLRARDNFDDNHHVAEEAP